MPNIAVTHKPGVLELDQIIQKSFRRELINCLELQPENYLYRPDRQKLLREITKSGKPYSFHFLSNSMGSIDYPKRNRFEEQRKLLAEFNPILVSDHLSCCQIGETALDGNFPVQRSEEMVEVVAENIGHFIKRLGPVARSLLKTFVIIMK